MKRTGQRATTARPPGSGEQATIGVRRVGHVMGTPVTMEFRDRPATATLNRLAEQVLGW